jgi:cysteine-rich repeat protein
MRTMTIAVAFLGGLLVLATGGTARAQSAVCGNGAVEAPELCDDGNLVDGDGCDSNCTPTGCGNGIVTAGEQCDDGNLVDGDCCSSTCTITNQPPVCTDAFPSVDLLWPPNHKMVSVGIEGVTDPDGDPLTVTVTAISQDEPIDATGDGATCPDGLGVGTDGAELRSERSGNGDGRTYHVAFQATDVCNATCTGEVVVCVRHDNRPGGTCGDGGALYDSTLGVPPCEGNSCGPEDCVPDPGEVEGCEDQDVPASVEHRLAKAQRLLSHGKGHARGAAKQLAKAAARAAKAAKHGNLSDECAAALAHALEGAGTCAMCSE